MATSFTNDEHTVNGITFRRGETLRFPWGTNSDHGPGAFADVLILGFDPRGNALLGRAWAHLDAQGNVQTAVERITVPPAHLLEMTRLDRQPSGAFTRYVY